jgi:hypothetical protein
MSTKSHARLRAAMIVVGLAGCGTGGGDTGTGASDTEAASSGSTGGGMPTTGGPTTGEASTGGGGSTGGGASTGEASTGGGASTGEASTGGSGGTTGEASTGGGSTGEASTGGSTGGVVPFSHFACTETTPVELLLREAITGAFDAQGLPLDVTAVMVKSGATEFHVDVAKEVAPNDPYAADVAFWEQDLTAKGWDVNPPDDLSGDRRYIFIPDGAQFVAKFSLFYYHVYEGGGNGQFEFECLKQ